MSLHRYDNMFKWDKKYSVGVLSIDNQHKQIFVILDKLYNSLKRGHVEIVLDQIIPELEDYIILHFKTEEFFFGSFNYEATLEHIAEHDSFKQKMNDIKAEIKSGRTSLSFDLMIFLKNWIEHHILLVDKKYSECFIQNGLK